MPSSNFPLLLFTSSSSLGTWHLAAYFHGESPDQIIYSNFIFLYKPPFFGFHALVHGICCLVLDRKTHGIGFNQLQILSICKTLEIKMASISLLRLSRPPPQLLHRHCLLPPSPLNSKPKLRSPAAATIKCSYNPTPATDRLISAASYFLPFFNGLQYGRFLFAKYPMLAVPLEPLLPLLSLYHSFPYASFVTFFGLYLGVVRNPSFSRYARFNALQALVLDVLLVVPVLLQRIFTPGRSGIGLKFTAWLHSGLFVFIVACFVYGLVASILGKTPYLPLVADAAGRQFD